MVIWANHLVSSFVEVVVSLQLNASPLYYEVWLVVEFLTSMLICELAAWVVLKLDFVVNQPDVECNLP